MNQDILDSLMLSSIKSNSNPGTNVFIDIVGQKFTRARLLNLWFYSVNPYY